jgi:hypothetical protein
VIAIDSAATAASISCEESACSVTAPAAATLESTM